MVKVKCRCGHENVYRNEKDAYMDGWYYRDGQTFYNTDKAIVICEKCQEREKFETVAVQITNDEE